MALVMDWISRHKESLGNVLVPLVCVAVGNASSEAYRAYYDPQSRVAPLVVSVGATFATLALFFLLWVKFYYHEED